MYYNDDDNDDILDWAQEDLKGRKEEQSESNSDGLGDDARDKIKDDLKERLKEKQKEKADGKNPSENGSSGGAKGTGQNGAGGNGTPSGSTGGATGGTPGGASGGASGSAGASGTAGATGSAGASGTAGATGSAGAAGASGTAAGGAAAGGTAAGGAATGGAAAGGAAAGGAAAGGAAAGGAAAGGAAAAGGSAAAAGVAATPVGWIILIVIAVIILIIVLIGIIAFLLTLPGIMSAKIDSFFSDVSTDIAKIFLPDAVAETKAEDVLNLANYLNDMEYDLVGFGFVKPDRDSTVAVSENLIEQGYKRIVIEEDLGEDIDENNRKYKVFYAKEYDPDTGEMSDVYQDDFYDSDGKKYNSNGEVEYEEDSRYKKYGITYDDSGKVISLNDNDKSILRTYALSERSLYVIRNGDETFWGQLLNYISSFICEYDGAWAQGLLELWTASNGEAEDLYSLWDKVGLTGKKISNIKITKNNEMYVKVGLFNNPLLFKLDGWSGRYGMSEDFLISLHLATLSPDLVTTIAQTFDTRVQVYLDYIKNAKVKAYFHTKDMVADSADEFDSYDDVVIGDNNSIYVDYDTIASFKNDSSKWNVLDNLFLSKKEAKKIMDTFHIESLDSGKYVCGGQDPSEVLYFSGSGHDKSNDSNFCFTDLIEYEDNSSGDSLDYYDDVFKNQYFDDYNSFKSALNVEVIDSSKGETFTNKDKKKYVAIDKYTTEENVGTTQGIDSSEEEPDEPLAEGEEEKTGDEDGEEQQEVIVMDHVSVSMHSNNNDFRTSKVKSVMGMLNDYYDAILADKDSYNVVSYTDCPMNFFTIFDYTSPGYIENYISYGDFTSLTKSKKDHYECEVAVFQTNDSGLTEGMDGYDPDEDGEIIVSLLIRKTGADKNYDLAAVAYRNFSVKEMEEKGFLNEGETAVQLCSESDDKTTCSNCRRYVSDIIKALKKVKDNNFAYYQPYIARVVGSWFRDTYFIIPETEDPAIELVRNSYDEYKEGDLTLANLDIIQNDTAFQNATGELWTDYLLDEDNYNYALFVIQGNGSFFTNQDDVNEWVDTWYSENKIANNIQDDNSEEGKELSAIYNVLKDALSDPLKADDGLDYYGYINPNTTVSDEVLQYIVNINSRNDNNPTSETGKTSYKKKSRDANIEQVFKELEISYIKRPKTTKMEESDSLTGVSSGWSAYQFDVQSNDSLEPLDINSDSPAKISRVYFAYNQAHEDEEDEALFYYNIDSKQSVSQFADGERGMTNEKIKYLFKNKKYYKYDGSVSRAYNIRDDWSEVLKLFENTGAGSSAALAGKIKAVGRQALKNGLLTLLGDFNDAGKLVSSHSNFEAKVENAGDDAREVALNGYVDLIYYQEYETIRDNFEDFKFARDFNDDGIADIASMLCKVGDNVNGLDIDESTVLTWDPRNPGLISKVDLSTESLQAFSILENTHTADADYAYRDLKELFVELDYFDKEDLVEPAKDVMEWLLPESGSAGWPNREYDKVDEYGTLIHSKEMYDNLNSIYYQTNAAIVEELADTEEEVQNLMLRQQEEMEAGMNDEEASDEDTETETEPAGEVEDDEDTETESTEDSESEEVIQDPTEPTDDETDTTEDFENEEENQDTTESTDTEALIHIDEDSLFKLGNARVSSRSRSSSSSSYKEEIVYTSYYEHGYVAQITINGATFNAYKQGSGAYYTDKHVGKINKSMQGQACGPTSLTTILSGFGEEDDPWQVVSEDGMASYDYTFSYLSRMGTSRGVEFEEPYIVTSSNVSDAAQVMKEKFEEGKVCILLVDSGNNGRYTSDGHYMAGLGMDSSGGLIFTNCGNKVYPGVVEDDKASSLETFIRTYMTHKSGRGFMFTKEAPGTAGKKSTAKAFEGFEQYEPIVSPATAKILEMGTVTINNEGKAEALKNIYVGEYDDEELAEMDDEDTETKLIVNQEKYEEIETNIDNLEEDEESSFGKTYETGYVKLEVIGKESLDKIQAIDSDLYQGFEAFYKDYHNVTQDKSICDSYTIYIEGIDLTGFMEENADPDASISLDETILGQLFANVSGQALSTTGSFTSNDTVGSDNDGSTSTTSSTSSSDDTEGFNIDTYDLNYYTEKEIPSYYVPAVKQEMQENENIKSTNMPSVVKVDNDIYVKAGTLLGVTGKSNMRIIMKDEKEAVVENVEDYLEIDDFGESKSSISSDIACFFFIPYEGGRLGIDPKGTYNGNAWTGTSGPEVGMGIIQWTTLPNTGMNNISNILCKKLYDLDPSFCAGVQQFISWSPSEVWSDIAKDGQNSVKDTYNSQIKQAFKSMDDKDHDHLLELECQVASEDYYTFMESQGVTWILDRNPGLIGSYYSLLAWAPNAGWQNYVDSSKSDEANIISLYKAACNRTSTAGSLNDRWNSQAKLAIDMVTGGITDEEVMEWMNTAQSPEGKNYSNGANPGFINNYNVR